MGRPRVNRRPFPEAPVWLQDEYRKQFPKETLLPLYIVITGSPSFTESHFEKERVLSVIVYVGGKGLAHPGSVEREGALSFATEHGIRLNRKGQRLDLKANHFVAIASRIEQFGKPQILVTMYDHPLSPSSKMKREGELLPALDDRQKQILATRSILSPSQWDAFKQTFNVTPGEIEHLKRIEVLKKDETVSAFGKKLMDVSP